MSEHDTSPTHIPVLLQEVIEWSNTKSGSIIIDGTLGFGGHAEELIKRIQPNGRYIGIDKDEKALDASQTRLKAWENNLQVVHGHMSEMKSIAQEYGAEEVDMILLDLGVSSPQLDNAEYGISFSSTGPLDMRIGFDDQSPTAAEVLNTWSESELKKLFTDHGQPATNRLVARIIETRDKSPLESVEELLELIGEVVPREPGLHPATRVFQALRVVVNQEEEELRAGLEQAVSLLKTGGRLLVISFHSGEDRIVKDYMAHEAKDCICPPEYPVCICGHIASLRILTKHPITASEEELRRNPRARSAKMRVAEKL